MPKIAFLGAGNIAQAMITGLKKNGFNLPDIIASDPSADCRDRVAALGIAATQGNLEAVVDSDIVMLCVKPDRVSTLLAEVADTARGKLIVSVVAGITTRTLGEWFKTGHTKNNTPIIRCMPNTPALVQTGMTAMFATDNVTEAQRQEAENILGAVGVTLWVDHEADLDAVTAVSGSGPAYFFLLMESMISAGIKEGLSADVARQLVLQTALGSAKIALAQDAEPTELRRRVTSPGGTTQAAVDKLTEAGFREMVEQAIKAARERSVELSET